MTTKNAVRDHMFSAAGGAGPEADFGGVVVHHIRDKLAPQAGVVPPPIPVSATGIRPTRVYAAKKPFPDKD